MTAKGAWMSGTTATSWNARAGALLPVLLMAAFLLRAFTAQAGIGTEDKKEKAKKHFNRAIQFFDKGKYEDALIDFEVSYDYRPHWKIKYNMALCHYHLGHFIAAADLLEAFLREGGQKVSAEESKQAGEVLANIKKKVGTLTLTGEVKGSLVKIDGKKVEGVKDGETVFLEPGKHLVYVASSDSVLVDETIDFEAGESKEILVKVLVVKTGPASAEEGAGEEKTVKAEIKGKKASEAEPKKTESKTEAKEKAKKDKAEEKALKAEAKEKEKKARAEQKALKAEAKEKAKKAKAEEKALKAEAEVKKEETRRSAPLDPLTVSAWAMVGVGSAALLSAVIVGGLAGKQRALMKDAEDEYMAKVWDPAVTQEELDAVRKDRNDHFFKGRTMLYAMAGLLAAGTALAAASVTLLILPREKKDVKTALSLPQLSLGPGGALVTFSFR
jgi:hypothetical protein